MSAEESLPERQAMSSKANIKAAERWEQTRMPGNQLRVEDVAANMEPVPKRTVGPVGKAHEDTKDTTESQKAGLEAFTVGTEGRRPSKRTTCARQRHDGRSHQQPSPFPFTTAASGHECPSVQGNFDAPLHE